MESLEFNKEYLCQIELNMKRFDQSFSFPAITSDSISELLKTILLVITTTLEERDKLEKSWSYSSQKSISSTEGNQPESLILAKSNLKKAQKHLKEYEYLLREKEVKLQSKEEEFNLVVQDLKDSNAKYLLENETFKKRIKGYEKRILIRGQETCLEDEYKLLAEEKKNFEIEKINIMGLKKKIESNYKQSEKLLQVNLIQRETLAKEINKYETFNSTIVVKIEESEKKKIILDKLQEKVNNDLNLIEKEKSRLEEEKSKLNSLQLEKINQRAELSYVSYETVNKARDSRLLEQKESQLANKETKEIELLYTKLKSQIEVYNDEVTIREFRLEESQKKLRSDQAKLAQSFSSIKIIISSLQFAKKDILTFYTQVFPEIEKLYKDASNISCNLKEMMTSIKELQVKEPPEGFAFSFMNSFEEQTEEKLNNRLEISRPLGGFAKDKGEIDSTTSEMKLKEIYLSELNKTQHRDRTRELGTRKDKTQALNLNSDSRVKKVAFK